MPWSVGKYLTSIGKSSSQIKFGLYRVDDREVCKIPLLFEMSSILHECGTRHNWSLVVCFLTIPQLGAQLYGKDHTFLM